ncbi:MAG: DUF58 domain-containing protein [Oligoflexales bacterium]
MLDKGLMAQIKSLEIKARHLASQSLTGEYASVFKGFGIEFDEIREYAMGDDVRNIDWNVTAKMNQPYIKVFREEREMTLFLLIDVSFSQHFGSFAKTKRDIAAELAAILALLASNNNDKIGLIMFSDRVEKVVPPLKARGHVWQILRNILTHETKHTGTNIAAAVDAFSKLQKRKSVCFVISDFLMPDYEKPLKTMAARHDVIAATIVDPHEASLPGAGYVRFQDLETGETHVVDASDPVIASSIQRKHEDHAHKLGVFFNRTRIDHVRIDTTESVIKGLVSLIRKRDRRSAGA